MATPGSLGDFFAKKGKSKKTLGVNLNKVEAKPEEKKVQKVGKEEEGWEEDEVVAPTMKVESVAKLSREEEKKEEEETAAPAWGNSKSKKGAQAQDLNDKRFPTLAKALGSSNINLDDEPKVNIKTTKNAFAALEEDGGDGPKSKKTIQASLVTKQKGESQKEAVARELKKAKDDKKKKKKADDEDYEESAEEEEEVVKKEIRPQVKKVKAKVEAKEEEEEDGGEEDDGPKIQPDLEASRQKYAHRRKLDKADLPRSELEEQKENRPVQQTSSKKKKFAMEEEEKPKLLVWED